MTGKKRRSDWNRRIRCGFPPQYALLEELYPNYATDGRVVLGFPCNPFGYQEPGGADSIRETCRIRYGVTFPVFVKIGVKGPEAQPLFRRLTKQLPGRIGRDIQRNFTQFLIGRDGMPLQRFASVTAPRKPDSAIRLVAGVDFPPEKAATLRRLLTELMDQLRESTAT